MIHNLPIYMVMGLLKGIVIFLDLAKQDAYLGPEHLQALSFRCIPPGESSSAIWGSTRLSVSSRKSTSGPQDHSEFKWIWS